MIHVQEAKEEIISNTPLLSKTILLKSKQAIGYILAEDLVSPINLPPFDQSEVDGYAVKLNSTPIDFYQLINEIQTGEYKSLRVEKKESVRIFTGGLVPPEADCIITQENIVTFENIITVKNILPKKGDNIRYKGSQIKKGELAFAKGVRLNVASIGFLCALGIDKVKVLARPSVSIIATGDELIASDESLLPGKIFESNIPMLSAALHSINASINKVLHVKADEPDLKNALRKVLPNSNIIILTGGISVGKYDLVRPILEKIGTRTIFYKVAQRPGNPLYFGKLGNTLIFGLPGNPDAALTCFYEYVYPALRKMQGYDSITLPSLQLPLNKDFCKKPRHANFLKGKILNDKVHILEGRESSTLKSYAQADCLIYIPQEREAVIKGELVEVHLLPQF
jgi:molybdopterin molybdotransferase